ncbi:Gfo/Idh/MocA family protein [Campylobacter vicugnae]|uniref:Gfo/Idh/MocA family protein n=1 Tax=Campylobacter vicugnae TaxID=1660076 RepID=UPI000A336D3A|nr:Gfo/Idh/MocA family oxidoreductase [Campylobacter sp. RM8970]
MKALIISMGSIGTRHAEVLTSMGIEVSAITSQIIRSLECFNDLKSVNLDKFDYFIIASPTHLHYEHLNYIDTNVSGKIILCEKPLFDKFRDFNPNNKIFIGYNLRFHPLILELKNMLNPSEILTIEARCGQYLPSWRKRKYTSSYSAKKELGGGVLLDLSHEIDYLSFLCDSKLELIKSYQAKVSNLNITSDDVCMILAKCNKTLINISLNYLSKTPYRQILIETNNNTYHLDLITNRLKIVDQDGKITQIQKPNLQRNDTFKAMHIDALNMQNHICTFSQAMDTMRLIDQIQKENI